MEEGRPVGSEACGLARNATLIRWLDGTIIRIVSFEDIDTARVVAERLAAARG